MLASYENDNLRAPRLKGFYSNTHYLVFSDTTSKNLLPLVVFRNLTLCTGGIHTL